MVDPKIPSTNETGAKIFDFDQLESRLDKILHPNLIDVIIDNVLMNIVATNKAYRFTNRRIHNSTESNVLVYIEKCEDAFNAIKSASPSFRSVAFFEDISKGIAELMCPDEGAERDAVEYCIHCALMDAYKEN